VTTPAECQEFLARHPGIEAVQLFITDPSGVPRGKTASVEELPRLYTHGRPVAGSILGLDITGTDVESTASSGRRVMPISSAGLCPAHWHWRPGWRDLRPR